MAKAGRYDLSMTTQYIDSDCRGTSTAYSILSTCGKQVDLQYHMKCACSCYIGNLYSYDNIYGYYFVIYIRVNIIYSLYK